MIAILKEFERGTDVLTWSVSGLKNSGSTKPSSDFSVVNVFDKDGYIVSSVSGAPTIITNRTPASLTTFSLGQTSLKHNEPTMYKINFTPVNSLPATASILITYPTSIDFVNGALTVCEVTTSEAVFKTNCVIDPTSRSIIIKSVFAASPDYKGEISITLLDVRNPPNNKPGSGFVIQTYADSELNYI